MMERSCRTMTHVRWHGGRHHNVRHSVPSQPEAFQAACPLVVAAAEQEELVVALDLLIA